MAKNKNKEKAPRLSKKEIHEGLLTLFEMNPTKDLDIKHIFRHLQAKTHGAKMLVMDVIDDLVFDDYLARAAEGVYRRVHRSNDMNATDTISSCPMMAEKISWFANAMPCMRSMVTE